MSEHEARLAMHLNAAKIPFEQEYRALLGRKFRFDFFIAPDLLIEVEGGIFIKGAHSTGIGITRDIEKNNLAVLAGFRLLRFTAQMIQDGTALRQIEEAIKQ